MRRRNRGPLEIRLYSYAFMALATLVGGMSGADESPIGMIVVFILSIAAAACYVRAADFLIDFDYKSIRRQATLFTVAGLGAALIGCAVASQLTDGDAPILIRTLGYAGIGGGVAIGLSGLVALLWSFTGYAGEQIDKRSNEEW